MTLPASTNVNAIRNLFLKRSDIHIGKSIVSLYNGELEEEEEEEERSVSIVMSLDTKKL